MLLGWLGSNCWTASLPWLGDEPHEKSDPPALDRGPFLATSRRRRQSRDVDVEQHPGQLKLELRASPRVCPVCAAYLDERRPDAVYCSDTCRSAARDRQRAARRFDPERPPCPMCGTSMAGRRYGAVYCSPTCRVRAWRVAQAQSREGDRTRLPVRGVQKRTQSIGTRSGWTPGAIAPQASRGDD
jgi:predicted nucleic acid-binding Zn ribbon protein